MSAGFHFHFDAGLTDERAHTWTDFGPPSVQSSAAKFGAAGLTLDGASGLYLQPTAGGDMLATGAFTVEGWVKIAGATPGHIVAFRKTSGGGINESAWALYYNASTGLRLYNVLHGDLITSASIPRNQWAHVAWTRDAANDMRLFVDGAVVGTANNAYTIDPTFIRLFHAESNFNANYDALTGDADEFIFDPGVCRYTAAFTPPTGPFTGPATAYLAATGPLQGTATPAIFAAQQFGSVAATGPLGAPAITAAQFYGQIALTGPLGAPAVYAAQQAAIIAMGGPIGAPAIHAAHQFASVAATAPLGAPAILGTAPTVALIALAGPLATAATPAALAWHDFTAGLGTGTSTYYVMDLVTPGGLVRVPISSWQATLQTEGSGYVQCVVPAAAAWIDAILDATEFIISRQARLPAGQVIEYEMARSPLEQREPSQGPGNYTVVLSGYPDALTPNEDPPTAQDRTLAGVRSVAGLPGSLRVRADIDWLLRPGMRAYQDSTPILVDYINYYCPGNDQYMDVGERA